MDQKLLLKEKDFQLISTKSLIPFKHAFHDPLINPPKKKIQKNKAKNNSLGLKQNSPSPLLANNILSKVAKSSLPMKSQIPTESKLMAPAEDELDNKIEVTPWTTILKFFLKTYDLKNESLDTQVGNSFGSQGLKMQDHLLYGNSMTKTNSPIKAGQKDTRSTISMKAYIKILEDMKKDLRAKWKVNDKVGSLQITIQACKLLHDTSHAKFHALKFAYVMEIVEEFGINVFKRIKSLSFPAFSNQRIDQIAISDLEGANVPESAQQICRNWLLKISSIRELIPRTIVETTLLRLHFFLDNGSKSKRVLYRLARSNRCFGEYINCIFFCTFLVRMGAEVLPQDKDYILDILDDVFFYIKQGKTKFSRSDITYDQFFVILEPFFISTFESLAENLSREKFKRFCNMLPQNPHPIILKNFIQSFSPSLLVYYSTDIVKMLQKLYKQYKYSIYKILLERLSGMTFSQSGQFIMLAWTDISEINDIEILLDLLGPFSNIIFKNLPRYEKNKFYSLILESFNNLFDNFRNLSEKVFISFKKFLIEILANVEEIGDIITLQPFLQIVSYFPLKIKNELSISITQAFLTRDEKRITDPVVVHIILSLMKNVQPNNITNQLVLKFLEKIDFANDVEQSLDFYCQMRANFGQIQKVTVSLIYKAAGLTFKARKVNKGRVTNKLISFLQAALAYCYITVPVLENNSLKLKMYLYLSEIALANNLISQATSLIKTCITQLAEVDTESDKQVYQIFYRIISFLIVMPDDPQSEYLFLFNGLVQAFSLAKLKTNYEAILSFQFYTQCIVYLSCQAQERLPFHIDGVTSNDGLFKSIEFRKALVERIHQIADLLEVWLPKILQINGGPEIQAYTVIHLSQCLMTLLGTFDQTVRLRKLIKAIFKVLDKYKDKLFAGLQKPMQQQYRTCLNGVNQKLEEIGFQMKIAI